MRSPVAGLLPCQPLVEHFYGQEVADVPGGILKLGEGKARRKATAPVDVME
jgi:hypothetical protein